MNSKQKKMTFAVMAVVLMMLSPLALSVSNDSSDGSAIKSRGSIPEPVNYQYIIKQDTAGTQVADVQVYVNGAWTSEMSSDTEMNPYWNFSSGLGPFNSFYAAINLYEQSNEDDLVEQRINTKVGGIAYVLNPENLTQTMQGTSFTPAYYNVMLVIPTVYWYSVNNSGNTQNYLLMSNQKEDGNFGDYAGLSGVSVSFSTNADCAAHTFTNTSDVSETYKYIALGVYETSTMSINNQTQAVSMAGKVPQASSTTNNINMHRTWAENGNNDNGYYMVWNLYQWTLYKMMAYTVLGNKDVQYMMGMGNTGIVQTTNTGADGHLYEWDGSAITVDDDAGTYVKVDVTSTETTFYVTYSDKVIANNTSSALAEFSITSTTQPSEMVSGLTFTISGSTSTGFLITASATSDTTIYVPQKALYSGNTGRDGGTASSYTGQATAAYTPTPYSDTSTYGAYGSVFLENTWGSLWEYVDDTYVDTSNKLMAGNYLVFSELSSTYASDTGVVFANTSNSGKLISGTNTTVSGAWDIPTTASSSSPSVVSGQGTTVNDAVWFNSSIDTVLLVGGYWGDAANAGLAAAYASDALGYGNSHFGSRLAYALSADAAEPSDDGSTYTARIIADDMVTVKAGNTTLSDGDTFDAGQKVYVTLNSRIPVGEELIVTTYDLLGNPLKFTSSSAIGDELIFTPTGDLFIYLDVGMIESVVYQPTIYESNGDVKDGKEAIVVTLADGVSSYVWYYDRIINSSVETIQSDSAYFTGDTIVIELDKNSGVNTDTVSDRYARTDSPLSYAQSDTGAWVKLTAGKTYYIPVGATISAYNTDDSPALADYVISSKTVPSEMNTASGLSISVSSTYRGCYQLTVTDSTSAHTDVYIPYTYYYDWAAGTYYFSLQTESKYIYAIDFPFMIGAYAVTIAEDSDDYIDSVTVNGVERYKLNANEVAQIHLDAAAISGLDDYHVYISYNDEIVEVTPVRTGMYRFVMPAYDVEISLSTASSGYSIGMMYTYGVSPAFKLYIVDNLGGSIPAGTVSAEGYGEVGGKLYDGTSFHAIVHETVFSANVDATSNPYLVQELDFTPGTQLTSLSTITAVVPVYSITGSSSIAGNQYFAPGFTKSADNGAMSVVDGKVVLAVNDYVSGNSYNYSITVYYDYDISTGESTKTILTSMNVASGTLTDRLTVISIDYEALGIDEDRVAMYRSYIASEQTMDVLI